MNTDMRSEFVYMRYEWQSDPVWYRNIEAIFSHLILHKNTFYLLISLSASFCFFLCFFLQRSCCILLLDPVPNFAKTTQQNHKTCPSAYPFTAGVSKYYQQNSVPFVFHVTMAPGSR
jgi:hypothetical protein